ncbi:hypothetical protein P12x_002132 [Tundrisphaera lichenicola]|uniref:hypothetical protein n=1 Tax=Tundrisphaera lichenicola TaxID=2029860 RepID=UPI003EB719DA
MAYDRTGSRRPSRRNFQPTIDGRLETRVLLAKMTPIMTQIAANGQASVVTNTNGQQFFISVINGGTVRAFPAVGGRVNLVVDGSTPQTLLEINQIVPQQVKGSAHKFNSALAMQTGTINIASITVSTGTIGAIEGYNTAILSGTVAVGSTNPVNRMAFQSIAPGASIGVGGDLNTLDVLYDAKFSGSSGLFVGRDLNSFSVGGNLSFSNGANLNIVRDSGLVPQAAKGTGPAGQGISVIGNMSIDNTSGFSIGRYLDGFLVVDGNYSGAFRTLIGGNLLPNYIAINASLTPPVNNVFVRGTFS